MFCKVIFYHKQTAALLFLVVFHAIIVKGQVVQPKITPFDYGFVAAFNFSSFHVKGNSRANIYESPISPAIGAFAHYSINKYIRIESGAQYTFGRYQSDEPSLLLNDGQIHYLSVPLLVHFIGYPNFAVTGGLQQDFILKINDPNNNVQPGDFKSNTLSWTLGCELLPQRRVSFWLRYVNGMQDMLVKNNPNRIGEWRYLSLLTGVKYRFKAPKRVKKLAGTD